MRFSNSSDQLGGAEMWEISLDLGCYEESLSLESQGRSHADGSLEDYGVAFAEYKAPAVDEWRKADSEGSDESIIAPKPKPTR
jgi:hypothetical protein